MENFLKEIDKPMAPSKLKKSYPELVTVWKSLLEVVQDLNASEVIQKDEKFESLF
jgi:hypothetical protein